MSAAHEATIVVCVEGSVQVAGPGDPALERGDVAAASRGDRSFDDGHVRGGNARRTAEAKRERRPK